MRRFKNGDIVKITRPVCIRRRSGSVEFIDGKMVTVVNVGIKNSQCDIGIDKLVFIPNTHLKIVA